MKKLICIVLCIFFMFSLTNCAEEKEEDHYYDIIVYVSRYEKIHAYPDCSGMIYYTSMPLKTAIKEGYAICKKCEEDICQAIYQYNKHYYDNYDYYDDRYYEDPEYWYRDQYD